MIRSEKTLLFAWFVISLVIGVLTVNNYGMSVDEPNNYRYAADTLAAYPSLFGILYEPRHDSSYEGHGPAFVAMAGLMVNFIQQFIPDVFAPNLWHISYYITFLLCGLCVYWLVKRWFDSWTAWGILLLFSTQPLLLGHAFINPKDIPFMFFFTLSIVLGFRLVDHMEAKEPHSSLQGAVIHLGHMFRLADAQRKKNLIIFFWAFLAITLALVLFSNPINSLIEQTIAYFYTASPETWAGRLFNSVASQAGSVTAQEYAAKAIKLFDRIELGFLAAGLLIFLVYFGLILKNTTFYGVVRNTWEQRNGIRLLTASGKSSLKWVSVKIWLTQIVQAIRSLSLIYAGIALGLATAIRAIAPLAGAIVFFYLLVKARSKAWETGIAYFLVAGITTYLAWPYLWAAPLQRYWQELTGSSNFQNFSGQVLFGGVFYGIRELPRLYLPVLLNIQFTEPLILGVYIGFGILIWRIFHNQIRTDLLLYLGFGFILPLSGLILLNSPLYHNFRQVLFLSPPLFILAAVALETLFRKMTQGWARLLLIAVIALPGVYKTVQLYPYEYVYYNALVGGTAGAANRYELDYWRTTMREAALKLNALAPSKAKIVVGGSSSLFRRYGKPDLVVDTLAQHRYDLNGEYDYAVQLARWQKWEVYPDARIEILIERDGAVLATVRAVRNARLR